MTGYAETIRSAAAPDASSLSTLNDAGQPTGFSVELFRESLAAMGYEAFLRSGEFAEIKKDLEKGRLDALPAVIRTPERMKALDFSVPYMIVHGALFVRDDNASIRSLSDLPGKRIAVREGVSSHEYVLRAGLSDEIIALPTHEAAFMLLSEGGADVVVAPKEIGYLTFKNLGLKNIRVVGGPNEELHQPVCFAVQKGNAELLAVLNEGLAKVTANGTRRRLASQWLGDNPLASAKAKVIVYGGDHAYPPYEFLDEEGRPRGFNVDLLRAIAQEMGFDVAFQLSEWGAMRGRIERGAVDMGSMAYSAERAALLGFSIPHSELCMAVFSGPDSPDYRQPADLKGRILAVQRGDIMHDYTLAEGMKNQLRLTAQPQDVLALLDSGEVDFALAPRMPSYYWMRENGWRDLRAHKTSLAEMDYCFAVPKERAELIALLNEGLQRIKENGEYREIYDKWLGVLDPHLSRKAIVRYVLFSLSVLAVLGGIAGIIIVILQRQVHRRTVQLQQSNEALDVSRQHAVSLMEQALRAKESLELTQYTIDHSTVGVFWVRPDASFSYVNDEACRMMGYTREELLNLKIPSIYPDYDQGRWDHAWELLERGENVNMEVRCRTKNGRIFPVEIANSFIECDQGNLLCAFTRDVSERKQAELELRESRENLRITLNSIGDAVISTDTDCTILMMNPVAESMTGWTQNDAIGQPLEKVFRVIDEKTRAPIDSPVVRALETGSICFLSSQAILMTRDGREMPVADSAAPVRDDDQNVIGAVLAFSDQTKARTARKALNESRQLLRNVLDTVAARVWWKGLDNRYLGCNTCFADDAGLTPAEIIGKTDADLCWSEHAAAFVADDQLVIETGLPRMAISENQRTDGGGVIFIETNKVPLRDGCGRIVGTVGCYIDVSDRRRAEADRDRLEHQRQLALDAAQMGWWFFNPRTNILMYDRRLAAIFGMEGRECPLEDLFASIHPDDREQVHKAGDAAMDLLDPQPYHIEYRITHTDGSLRWIEAHGIAEFEGIGTLRRVTGFSGTVCDITERQQMRAAIEKRIVALTRPLGDDTEISFDELFNLEKMQRIQDEFADATGVASIITRPDGMPITRASNFNDFCEIVRGTQKGCAKCGKTDAEIAQRKPEGPVVMQCMSGGLLDAGVAIEVGGRQLASWKIGQVRDEMRTEEQVRAYAREIGTDEDALVEAFLRVPVMSREHFNQITQSLITLADQLSTSAYQNMQQARFIAERQQSEAALKESEQKYRQLFNDHSAVKLLIDAESGRIVDANPSAEEFYGWSHAELLKMNINQINTLPANEVEERLEEATEKRSSRFEFKHRRVDGSVRDVSVFSAAIVSGGRKLLHSIIYDITERKKVEQERMRLSQAIEQSPESVVITDVAGIIQYVNPAFSATSGYAREDALGETLRFLRNGTPSESLDQEIWQTLSSGRIWEGRLVNKRKNGELYTGEVSISPVKESDGATVGYVAVNRDITEDLAREERHRQGQKLEAIGQLAGGIAHDFNNMLQAILGFSQILLRELDPQSQAYQNVERIRQAGERATGLTRQLLAFSHNRPVEMTRTDLNQVVAESKELLNVLLGDGVTCIVSQDPTLKSVYADPSQLSQVVMNLAVNARDAMAEGGQLSITTENITLDEPDAATSSDSRRGRFICLSVSDTGCGMSAAVREHVFEPFFTTKGVGEGTGLGLSVVYGIVQQCQGWIVVESEEGQGSTFRIYLPEADSVDLPELKAIDQAPDQTRHILFICDEPKVHDRALFIVQSFDCETVVAGNVEEALSLFRRAPDDFGLLLCNSGLEGGWGLELADCLRKERPELPVLLFVDCDDPNDEALRREIEAKEYDLVQIPFTVSCLMAAVHRLFDEHGNGGA
jgi:PAS domain S-box-containing protein